MVLALVSILLASCVHEEFPDSDLRNDDNRIDLFVPAAEQVSVYSTPVQSECRIENAIVLLWDRNEDRIKDVAIVPPKRIVGNGTQTPSLKWVLIKPQPDDYIVVVCNYWSNSFFDVKNLIGMPIRKAQDEINSGKPSSSMSCIMMAGQKVWSEPGPVEMHFQMAKIDVVVDERLVAAGAPWEGWDRTYNIEASGGWTFFYTDIIPRPTDVAVGEYRSVMGLKAYVSANEAGLPPSAQYGGYCYTMEGLNASAKNAISFYVDPCGDYPGGWYCMTIDELQKNGALMRKNYFQHGKRYIFRIKDIYWSGYLTRAEAVANPSNVMFDIEVDDDWSGSVDYNGQYALKCDLKYPFVDKIEMLPNVAIPMPVVRLRITDTFQVTQTRIRLLAPDKKTLLPTSVFQLHSDRGMCENNEFAFKSYTTKADYVYLSTKDGPFEGGYVEIRRGNIVKYFPIGLLDPSQAVRIDEAGPANCYILSPASKGLYCFDASVMGNGAEGIIDDAGFVDASEQPLRKSGGAIITQEPKSWGLVWQDVQDLIEQVSYDPATKLVTFLVGNRGGAGNAVISLFDEVINKPIYSSYLRSVDAIWTWHIWFTDPPKDIHLPANDPVRFSGNAYDVMDCNLGAVSAPAPTGNDVTDSYKRSSPGLFYMWGTPVPYLSYMKFADGYSDYYYVPYNCAYHDMQVCYMVSPLIDNGSLKHVPQIRSLTLQACSAPYIGWQRYVQVGKYGYMKGFSPMAFWWGNPDGTNKNFPVKTVKTIYDPCPAGYKVAPGDVFVGFTKDGGYVDILQNGLNDVNVADGYDLSERIDFYFQGWKTGPSVRLPGAGYNGFTYLTDGRISDMEGLERGSCLFYTSASRSAADGDYGFHKVFLCADYAYGGYGVPDKEPFPLTEECPLPVRCVRE